MSSNNPILNPEKHLLISELRRNSAYPTYRKHITATASFGKFIGWIFVICGAITFMLALSFLLKSGFVQALLFCMIGGFVMIHIGAWCIARAKIFEESGMMSADVADAAIDARLHEKLKAQAAR
jgi:hypothetical protein